jgi:predicted nucleotidyltransferase
MHSEAYPEMASVLQRFVAGVQNALGSNFLGAYLVGSGDFDLDSDVDFLILTNAELSDAEVRSLQTTHVDIHARMLSSPSGGVLYKYGFAESD